MSKDVNPFFECHEHEVVDTSLLWEMLLVVAGLKRTGPAAPCVSEVSITTTCTVTTQKLLSCTTPRAKGFIH